MSANFWDRIRENDDGCWVWQGYLRRNGYGLTNHNGRTVQTHRLAYTIMIGDIPEGLELDHLCRNPSCVNPYHLDPVTRHVNSARATDSAAYKNRLKTHCPQGHPYDETNTYRHHGERQCITCMRNNTKRWRDLQRGGPPRPYGAAVTHCAKGHEFTSENTGRKSNGGRRCRACAREYARIQRHTTSGNTA